MTRERFLSAIDALNAGDFARCENEASAIPEGTEFFPGALALRGICANVRGDFESAVSIFRHLCRLEPDDPAHAVNLGHALIALRRFDEAKAAVVGSADRHGTDDRHRVALGLVAFEQSQFRDAQAHFRAMAASSHTAETLLIRGQAEFELGDTEAAEEQLKSALVLGLNSRSDFNLAGSLANLLGKPEEAERFFRRAIEGSQPHPAAYANLLAQLERLNRLDEARTLLSEAPPVADPAFEVARARIQARSGDAEAAMQAYRSLLDSEKLPDRLLYDACVEYGKLLDKHGRFDLAMSAFNQGHEVAIRMMETNFPGLDGAMPAEDWERSDSLELPALHWRHDSPRIRTSARPQPIFVIGFPRSGTTLIEQVLASHPNLYALDEVLAIERAIHEFKALGFRYPEALFEPNQAQMDRVESAYWEEVDLHATAPAGKRVVDKYPFNLVRLPMIYRLFPDAKVVMLIRHPADCVLSCYMQKFKLNRGTFYWATLESTARLYDRAMSAYERHKRAIGANVLEVRYESMTEDFEPTVRRIVEYVGEPWDQCVLDYSSTARKRGRISTPSYSQVTEPIYRRAVGRWEHYRRHLEPVLPLIQTHIDRLGY